MLTLLMKRTKPGIIIVATLDYQRSISRNIIPIRLNTDKRPLILHIRLDICLTHTIVELQIDSIGTADYVEVPNNR
jgi:hypothetical protein